MKAHLDLAKHSLIFLVFEFQAQSKPTDESGGVHKSPSASSGPQSQKRAGSSAEIEPSKHPRFCTQDETTSAVPAVDVTDEQTKTTPGLPQLSGGGLNDEALQSMLMAWYYSGYATGRYQALREVEEAAAAAAAAQAAQDSASSKPKNVD